MTAKFKSLKQVWGLIIVLAVFISVPAAFAQPTAAATATSKDTISLDFKDAEIGTVLRVLSLKSNVNIVAGPEVRGLVTVRLDDVPWQKALEVILRTYDYVFERDGNIIRVTSRERMAEEPVETKTFILDYSKAGEIKDSIMDILSERGRVKVAERTNMLVVTDIPTKLYQIGVIIKRLDGVTPQAYIDSKVIRTEAGQADNMGIQWNLQARVTGAGRPTTFPFSAVRDKGSAFPLKTFFPIQAEDPAGTVLRNNASDPRSFPYQPTGTGFTYGTLDFTQFAATLRMLEEFSNTKIVSNPRVVVLNNQTALIQVGSDYPIPSFERNEQTGAMQITGFDYRELGVVLRVTPHINSAEEILVDLTPEVSSAGALIPMSTGTEGFNAPSFNVTKAETQVLIQSGQTIAIGGLMTDDVTMTEDKVPYLASIPLIGKLFRSKRQTAGAGNAKVETLFFVTVTMVDSEGQPAGKRFADQNQKKGAQGPAQAVDKSVTGSKTASKSEAPTTEGTSSEKS